MRPRLENVSSRRGAPMGRPNTITESNAPLKLHLVYCSFVDDCYDQGGAYWGLPANLYCAWDDSVPGEVFVRAGCRFGAKQRIQAMFPKARFYR